VGGKAVSRGCIRGRSWRGVWGLAKEAGKRGVRKIQYGVPDIAKNEKVRTGKPEGSGELPNMANARVPQIGREERIDGHDVD